MLIGCQQSLKLNQEREKKDGQNIFTFIELVGNDMLDFKKNWYVELAYIILLDIYVCKSLIILLCFFFFLIDEKARFKETH